ncbi:MAG: tetratricopeptide repeat protein [Dehalococcoidales bacterium]|nr:tetratricopeptide repeat protein [Dehalococcoidales bacterium]
MVRFQAEDKAKLKRQRVEQAVRLAMENKWEEAVSVNRSIIELFSADVDAYNRLGKALTELSRYQEAREAYQKALQLDPMNRIAEKNLARLANISVTAAGDKGRRQLDPRFFVEETGKTGVTNLVQLGTGEVLARMSAGDQIYLVPEGRALVVQNSRGEYIGKVEPRLSQRLIDLMNGGNKYAAAITSMNDNQVTVIIREMERHPSQAGRVSFPFKPGEGAGIRPYIKSTLLQQYELEEEEEEENVEEGESGLEEMEEEATDTDMEDTEEAGS